MDVMNWILTFKKKKERKKRKEKKRKEKGTFQNVQY